MGITTLFFDLDDTMYPPSTGLWSSIRNRMHEYMHQKLGIPTDETHKLRRTYYETYGTTLRGLQTHFNVDAEDYLFYVHDLPLEDYLLPDPALRALLLSLPQRRYVFTNADARHARRVLKCLHLMDCFDGIVDVKAMGYYCKPDPIAFHCALAFAGESDPEMCIILDDAPRNLAVAKDLGFFTILIGSNQSDAYVDYALLNLIELRDHLPQLWKGSVE